MPRPLFLHQLCANGPRGHTRGGGGGVARFMAVKHGSVWWKGHIGGSRFVLQETFKKKQVFKRKRMNTRESQSLCLPAVTQQGSVNSIISTVVSLTRRIDPAEMSQCSLPVITLTAVHTKTYTPG